MRVFLAAGIIFICVYMCLHGFMKIDKNHGMEFTCKEWGLLLLGSLAAAGLWNATTTRGAFAEALPWLLLHIYFLSCSMTDLLTCQVYDVSQYLGICAAGCLLLRNQGSAAVGISLIVFSLLQYGIFMRMYGKADGMAFLVAALAEGALGYDINMYLLHMIMAYLLLSIMQAMRGNIGRKGRLKEPVAFLPYIMISFWGILIFGERMNHYI